MSKADDIVEALRQAYKDDWELWNLGITARDLSTMIVFVDTDGYNSYKALTFGEIADTIVKALELEKDDTDRTA